MIQRIQTLWLILAAASMALAFKFKFAAGAKLELTQNVIKDVTVSSHLLSLVFGIAFLAISLITIFLYKNRKQQMWLTFLAIIIGIATIYFLYWQTQSLTNVTYAITLVLPIAAIGFAISALRCIKQDEKKIEELNSSRLR
jgi:predicted neutral ceramidase superfamily lipid hydrolase